MKNVTISMDDDLLARVRVKAAKAGISVSRWIGKKLAEAAPPEPSEEDLAGFMKDLQAIISGPKFSLSEKGRIRVDREEMYGERFRRFDHPAVPAGSERAGEAANLRGVAEQARDFKSPGGQRSGSE